MDVRWQEARMSVGAAKSIRRMEKRKSRLKQRERKSRFSQRTGRERASWSLKKRREERRAKDGGNRQLIKKSGPLSHRNGEASPLKDDLEIALI